MGRGAARSSALIFAPRKRQTDWPRRIARMEEVFERDGVEAAISIARAWGRVPEFRPLRALVTRMTDAETERRWRWPSEEKLPETHDEIAYFATRVQEGIYTCLENPRFDFAALTSEATLHRWLWERPKDPGTLGKRLVDTPTSRGGKAGLPEMLAGLTEDDRRTINADPSLWEKPLLAGATEIRIAREVAEVEKTARDLLYRFDVLAFRSPHFYVSAKSEKTVHYEDPEKPGRTPCGLDLAGMKSAQRGDWKAAGEDSGRRRWNAPERCKICQKRDKAPVADDHRYDSVPIFDIAETKEVRAAILAALTPLPVEGEPPEMIEAMRGAMAEPCLDLALKAALVRFRALPIEKQGEAIRSLFWAMPHEVREEIRIERVSDICKRRLMEMIATTEQDGRREVWNLDVVKELADSGAFDPELVPRMIEAASERDEKRRERGW